LFLKQVVKIVETNHYILVLDLRETKKLFIPDQVIQNYESRLESVKQEAFKSSEYDGVKFILVPKD
jgi:predicted nucleic acid-binding protein